jgi:hypothetical protein
VNRPPILENPPDWLIAVLVLFVAVASLLIAQLLP